MTRTGMNAAAKQKPATAQGVSTGESLFDRELVDLPQELRWREWLGRIEAVLFASATPVIRDDLARVIGQGGVVTLTVVLLLLPAVGRR